MSKDMNPQEAARLQMEQCIFCKIIKGEIPSNKIFEDENYLAILDINPANEGHIILLPKKHYQIMPQIPDNELSSMMLLSKKLSKTLLQTYQTGGTSIFIANGGIAGQRAPHFLIHIIPRKKEDGLFNIPKKKVDENNLKQIQQTLVSSLSKMFGRNVIQTKKEEVNNNNNNNQIQHDSNVNNNVKGKIKNIKTEENVENQNKENDLSDSSLDKISEMLLK